MKYAKKVAPGTIYKIILDNDRCAFLQFLCVDSTLLWADVLRVFEGTYARTVVIPASEVAQLPVAFEIHSSVWSGLKSKMFEYIGIASVHERERTLYRSSEDYGNPEVRFSKRWDIWFPNEKKQFVGSLDERTRQAELGRIYGPIHIADKIETGEWTHWYPDG
jgi:hypothetical protein